MRMRAKPGVEQGFTLPELLIAGTFMLVFVGILLLIIRPNDYGAERRNAERRLELAQMMQAIKQYEAEKGVLPSNILPDEAPIATDEEGDAGLCADLVPDYLDDLPRDPADNTSMTLSQNCAADEQFYATGYSMYLKGPGHVVLTAPLAEKDEKITIERLFPVL